MSAISEISVQVIPTVNLTNSQIDQINQLKAICFSDVDSKEIREHFFAKGFAWVIATRKNQVIGQLELHKRNRDFEKSKFLLGGIGGVCVAPDLRRRGIGRQLMIRALEILSKQGCDVVCLNVDLEEPMYSFYEKLGFKMMEREASFTDIHGKRILEKGTMFKPLNSKPIYDLIMSNDTTFHYGNGYW